MTRKELQAREIWLIDLIEREGIRDGLNSMAEHPRYRELVKLQGLLYPISGDHTSSSIGIHDLTITANKEKRSECQPKAIGM